jgi:hypothetical protein
MREMQQDWPARIARMLVTAKADRKVERHVVMEPHGRGNVMNLQIDPRLPVADQDIGVDQRRFDVLR